MNEIEKCLDPQLWHACAGGMVQLPPVNSTVCYFPQGHAEHCQEKLDLVRMPPLILCKVETVKFLADKETDEVYSKIRLIPLRNNSDRDLYDETTDRTDNQEKPPSFAKTLTQSDANNGGGFSVPRYCAETIFPRLDYSSEPPVQTILARDVHGEVWKFRHIYRGTPRRHLLTTGWSNFVNQKKLVAGDSIIFLRADNGDLCVGVRRAKKEANSGWNSSSSPYGAYSPFLRIDDQRKICGGGRGGGKVRAESVMEAASLAANGHPFDVVYYPRASAPEFCVKASSVGASMRIQWCPGMRFKMPFENEDSSRISWFMGTISSVLSDDPIRWPNSPWRLLQVAWDEPDLLQDVKKVSPWLVELVSNMNMPAVHLSPFSPPRKKIRIPQPSDFPFIGQLPMSSFQSYPNNIGQGSGNNNPFVHLTTQTIPAGIQGARHAQIELTQSKNIFPPQPITNSKPLFLNFVTKSENDDGNVSCLLTLGLSNPSPKKTETEDRKVKTPPPTFVLFGQPILTKEQIFQTSSGSSDMNPTNNLSDGSDSAVIQNSPTENLSDEGSPWFKRNRTKSEPHTNTFRSYHRELYGNLTNVFESEGTEALSETGAIKHGADEPSHSASFRSV
ncbi:auxin response factor 18-like [Impatiens glandulifera]|uniref:auxin response factor 18-like n=1 Tax=Impatiens glandulifera TaxID=253017 RepID=UPI001FB0AE16|nr:auxin response factor 18-like [Impatiens glandulifera]